MTSEQHEYVYGDRDAIIFRTGNGDVKISYDFFRRAVEKADEVIAKIGEFDVDIFGTLGMRNLSAFIGEVFASSLAKVADGLLMRNPHQDGYPDLLILNEEGKQEIERLKNNLRDKKPFSPFKHGGIEVKASCGSVPTPATLQKRGLQKPIIGDTRINLMTGYDWKAHHRETINLVGVLWDFLDHKPTIVAIFYSNRIGPSDWGEIISPKKGGGRTTSVSIMNRKGVRKMYEGWVAVLKDRRYVDFLNRYNGGRLIPIPK